MVLLVISTGKCDVSNISMNDILLKNILTTDQTQMYWTKLGEETWSIIKIFH